MKQRSPNYEEALPAVDDALAVPPGLFKKPAHKAQGFYLVLTTTSLFPSIRTGRISWFSRQWLNSSTTRHQIDDEHNQRNDKQQMNESTTNVTKKSN
jgi:hypothetical protein